MAEKRAKSTTEHKWKGINFVTLFTYRNKSYSNKYQQHTIPSTTKKYCQKVLKVIENHHRICHKPKLNFITQKLLAKISIRQRRPWNCREKKQYCSVTSATCGTVIRTVLYYKMDHKVKSINAISVTKHLMQTLHVHVTAERIENHSSVTTVIRHINTNLDWCHTSEHTLERNFISVISVTKHVHGKILQITIIW